jgi:diphthamide synthase subunit DPH2
VQEAYDANEIEILVKAMKKERRLEVEKALMKINLVSDHNLSFFYNDILFFLFK